MKQQLVYNYFCHDVNPLYPMLGSVVRAVGKGWNVLIIVPQNTETSFIHLQSFLKNSEQLEVCSAEQLGGLIKDKPFELVVSLYKDHKTTQLIQNHSLVQKSHIMTAEEQPKKEEYDLISEFTQQTFHDSGAIAVTGNGKGKSTTAFGIAAEAMVMNKKVAVVQWFKEAKSGDLTWAINEHQFPQYLKQPELMTFYPTGAGFVGSPNMDRSKEETEHKAKAKEGMLIAMELINSGKYEVVVLDELLDTLQEIMEYLPYSLVEEEEVFQLLELAKNSQTKVIVTGRKIIPKLEKYLKTSIVITEVKHPWSTKKAGAVSGLDY